MPIVDTHAHLYSEDETRYPPIPRPTRPPAGTGTIEHLIKAKAEAGVTHVVAVQPGSFYRWDNRLMADTVRAHRDWMVGVCNLRSDDPASPDAFARLAEKYGVRGLRLEPPPDGGSYDHPGAAALCERAREMGLVICAHVNGTPHLPALARLLARFPEVPFVLDHCAYPKIEDPSILQHVLALEHFPNLLLKISFYLHRSTELVAMARQVIAAFSPDRCMWGGDFPAELWHPELTYAEHLQILMDEICRSEEERQAVLDTTPMRIWFPEQ